MNKKNVIFIIFTIICLLLFSLHKLFVIPFLLFGVLSIYPFELLKLRKKRKESERELTQAIERKKESIRRQTKIKK